MHDPSCLLFHSKLVEIWHDEPGGHDSGSRCRYASMRWHPQHWRIKFMPYVNLRRRLQRCAECGRRMNKATRNSYQSTDKVWHNECMTVRHLRSERLVFLEVLDRLFKRYDIDSPELLRAAVVDINERRDQFLLWYTPWTQIESYHKPETTKWRSPNEHLETA